MGREHQVGWAEKTFPETGKETMENWSSGYKYNHAAVNKRAFPQLAEGERISTDPFCTPGLLASEKCWLGPCI